jgi:hypothetical protein
MTAAKAPSVSVKHNADDSRLELGAVVAGVFIAFAQVPDHVVAQKIADAASAPEAPAEPEGENE